MLSGKKIIVGVTGSIAAYKSALLVRLLVKAGADIRVVMTPAAGRFISALTLSNLSQKEVFEGLWDGSWAEHVHLGLWADMMVVAPCSANTLAKMATGACDNALLAVYLSARCPVFVAPAMDADMYLHPSTQRNLQQLQADGVGILPAESGFLASGLEGQGRMAEPEHIVERLIQFEREAQKSMPLSGRKVLISAGPTREHIDPIRYLTNPSTGSMGYALCAEAKRLGAEVTLVSGPATTTVDPGVVPVQVTSAADMFDAVTSRAEGQDVVIMTAAVADYTPAEVSSHKIKKGDGGVAFEMVRTKDILKHLGSRKPDGQFLVGFALETRDGLANALSKLERKNLDLIVLNTLADEGAGFGGQTNKVTLLHRSGEVEEHPLKSKTEVAADIWAAILSKLNT